MRPLFEGNRKDIANVVKRVSGAPAPRRSQTKKRLV